MRTFIVSGAAGNLGTATVKTFLDAGHRVIAVARNDSPELEFARGSEHFSSMAIDLTDEVAAERFVTDSIARFGRIDGVLALAGGFALAELADSRKEALYRMFRLNFETAYHLVRPLWGHLVENDFGRVVLVGSRPAIAPQDAKHVIPYALSKSLLFELASILNASAKGKNVSATVVVPGVIDTPQNRKAMPDADFGKWVSPSSIATTLEFLCSEAGDNWREPIVKVYGKS